MIQDEEQRQKEPEEHYEPGGNPVTENSNLDDELITPGEDQPFSPAAGIKNQ